ncbi:MAG: 30S ribosomal protein S6 [Flavobacteriales bacterium]|nr:30S ribosomal protein S6 [Flavobacteriales bacterium]
MTNRYETVFILTPVLSEQQAKETVKSYTSMLKSAGSKLVHKEDWGLRKLAYPIQKKSTGFYFLMEHESDPSFIDKLEVAFRRDEKILRFLTIKMDKHHVTYAESRRDRNKETEKA